MFYVIIKMFSFSINLFCKYMCSETLLKVIALKYRHIILKTLVASLNTFLLATMPGTISYMYLVILVFISKCANVDELIIEEKNKQKKHNILA